MKKRITIHLALSLATYTVIYFLTCFVTWDLKNPFQWIIDIPIYHGATRLLILFGLTFCQMIIYLASYTLSSPK